MSHLSRYFKISRMMMILVFMCSGAALAYPPVQAYPPVHIVNHSDSPVWGAVDYAAMGVCGGDRYGAIPVGGSWTASSRGICLVTEITVGDEHGLGTSYYSTGTSYSKFEAVRIKGVLTMRRER